VTPADPPRVIRRVISEETARTLNQALVEAVSEGTGGQARLATFTVAGKSGTSRAMGDDARYEQGAYFASFVGFFPAERPQLVILVKLDRPQGSFFGGATAAPVTRATMEAILAARQPPLDRQALAMIARRGYAMEGRPGDRGVPALLASWQAAALEGGGIPRLSAEGEGLDARVVPDVRGLPARVVLRHLHARGFEVAWHGSGRAARMDPVPGTVLPPGGIVHVYGEHVPGGPATPSDGSPTQTARVATLGGAP
jgi:membrane peptidoglycan carboxypeptidase